MYILVTIHLLSWENNYDWHKSDLRRIYTPATACTRQTRTADIDLAVSSPKRGVISLKEGLTPVHVHEFQELCQTFLEICWTVFKVYMTRNSLLAY